MGPYAMAGQGFGWSPEELDRLLNEGWQLLEDGGLIPPIMGGNGIPNAGAMNAAENMPPPNAWKPGGSGSPLDIPPPPNAFSSPVFDAYNSVANPQPKEKDPLRRMMRGEKEPPPPVNLAVPGGASIENGMPQAAPMPSPAYGQGMGEGMPMGAGGVPPKPGPFNFKPNLTYNVTMATDPQSAQMQYQTEAQRGMNQQSKRDYEEMARERKVRTLRGFMGRS